MANALNNLHDIHLPTPISWWPLAPGYYGLIACLLLFLLCLFIFYRYKTSIKVKHEARQKLKALKQAYENQASSHLIASEISILLKQVALFYYERHAIAGLQGEAWVLFLSQTGKALDIESARFALLESPFHPEATHDLNPLFSLASAWIKQRRHRCLS
jgi:hypothetical protein